MQTGQALHSNENVNLAQMQDDDLVLLYKETADNHIIGEFYNRYAHLLLGVCMKYLKNENDSKDALMHVFEKLFEFLKMYEIGNFKAWIYSVTKHHCLFMLKKHKEFSHDEQTMDWKMPKEFVEFADDLTLSGHLNKKDESEKLKDAIAQLREEQRICIELFYLQEKSYQEVQNITKFDYNQVKSHIQNGKRNLKIMLENGHG